MARGLQDRFDAIPVNAVRQGTHRIVRRKRSPLFAFGWAALATGALVLLGILGLFGINDRIQFTDFVGSPGGGAAGTASSAQPVIQPITDPSLEVTVLNGTEVAGLATRVREAMIGQGWKVDTFANASDDTITTTTVYYGSAANQAAALGLSAALGGVAIAQSADFPGADLTVVLGADYSGPGLRARA